MRIGLYPGTFDPVTNGHLDIIGRAVKLVDRLVIGVAQNDDKGGQSSSEKVLSSLGLTVSPADDGNGLAITDVDPDSDAAARGLKTGEKITSVNNQQVASAADIEKILEQAKKDGRSKALFQIQTDDGSRFIALDIDQG